MTQAVRTPDPSTSRIPVLLVIDVEPDEFFIARDPAVRWHGFERAMLWCGEARSRIEAVTGVHAGMCWAFRTDHQIELAYGRADWGLREYRSAIDELIANGDALGVHAHLYRWSDEHGDWVIDQGNPEWVERITRSSIEVFENALQRRAEFFRFGDRWMSSRAMAELERCGVPFDLTLEPGRPAVPTYHPGHPFTGSIPDQRAAPRVPYRPSKTHFDRPATGTGDGLIAIPTTTAPVEPLKPLRVAPTPANALAWLRHRLRPWFDTAGLYQSPERLRSLVRLALDAGARHLCIPVRTDSFTKSARSRHVDHALEALLSDARSSRFEFTTPAGLMHMLDDAQRKPTRSAAVAARRSTAVTATGGHRS